MDRVISLSLPYQKTESKAMFLTALISWWICTQVLWVQSSRVSAHIWLWYIFGNGIWFEQKWKIFTFLVIKNLISIKTPCWVNVKRQWSTAKLFRVSWTNKFLKADVPLKQKPHRFSRPSFNSCYNETNPTKYIDELDFIESAE